MAYYITYGEFQQHMKDYFFRNRQSDAVSGNGRLPLPKRTSL